MSAVQPLRSPRLAEHGFRHGFSPRAGGVSIGPYASCNLGRNVGDDATHVAENRRRFAEAVGYAPEALFEVSQVHGRGVRRAGPEVDPAVLRAQEADALVADGGAAVGVRTADCVPVLVVDPRTRAVAAIHAGWRGVALDIAGAGVASLRELCGAPASRLVAALFPHIQVCCFEVSDEVAQELVAVCPQPSAAAAIVVQRPGERPHVDLAAILRLQLQAAGLASANIDFVSGCTRCDAERFFSFRRDGQASGRHVTAIVAG